MALAKCLDRQGPPEIELIPHALIPKLNNPVGDARRSLCCRTYFGASTTDSRCGQLDGLKNVSGKGCATKVPDLALERR